MKTSNLMGWLGVCLLSTLNINAQSTTVQRLSELANRGPSSRVKGADTTYANTLILLARAYYGVNADSSFYYGKRALQYADSTGYEKGKAESWRMIGNTYEMIGNYQEMLSAYHQSRLVAERIGNAAQVAKVNMNIALFYKQMGEYDEALEQIGKDSVVYDANGDSSQLVYAYSHLSDVSIHRQQYDQALAYVHKAIEIAIALKDSLAISSFTNDKGKILAAKGLYKEALALHERSMDYYLRTDDKLGEAETFILLARTNLLQKDYSKAIHYASKGLELARQLHRKKEIRDNGEVLADIYRAKGDDRTALRYFQLYKDYSDSLYNEQIRRQIFALEARYGYEKKTDSMRAAVAKQEVLQLHIDRAHTLQISIAIILILSLAVVAALLQRSRIASSRSNKELFEKNTKIEQQKEAMEHQAVQLLLNNQQKDKLFSIIAHDLKGPLNSLKGLLDLLKENRLPESEIRGMMDELRRNVDYSSELVGNLLFWASSQLNGITVTPVCLSLRQLVDEILNLYTKLAGEKNIVWKNDVDPGLTAYADKDMIQVILRNLLSNAIKFCRKGDTISITGRKSGNCVEICVADTGVGIKVDILEKIRRKESITTYGTAKEKGTGLGMLLCREFTEANGGKFRIDSEWGRGSWFYFTIPADASSSSMSV
ncbi:MAG TPA: tetratricopeptide repeat-containing sensor histidine kinase [Puia sp.]|nr:tetratricopeptide repeat-containing sensor histidine kinase [Puia sp.]